MCRLTKSSRLLYVLFGDQALSIFVDVEIKADGAAAPSITADLIRDLQGEGSELSPKDDQLARDVTGVAFAG